jgi:endonuclease/exonuclease/phosphatase family metal-dependent hydrolase
MPSVPMKCWRREEKITGASYQMFLKRRFSGKAGKILGPLVVSTLRRERKAYFASSHRDGDGDALVATYNIHKCVGVDGRFDPRRTMAVIQEIRADVIALQEVDQRFGNRDGLLDLQALQRESGLAAVPLTGKRSSHGWHGNLVLVRNAKVTGTRQLVLPGVEPRGALVVDLTLPVGPLRIIAAHLGLLRHSRARQVAALLSAAEMDDGRPTVLLGDLNEWRLGDRSSLRALKPVFSPLQANVASFPSRFPVWSLDRILGNARCTVSSIEVHDTRLARIASDHLPIKAIIRLGEGAQTKPATELALVA